MQAVDENGNESPISVIAKLAAGNNCRTGAGRVHRNLITVNYTKFSYKGEAVTM